ncbi:MAG TPA: LysR substrate-binding domain-containing protein [Polyangiaceae bacterium]|nr:LysR substrate-binding domain-containing protein [Polyangiaceae bacterium]
MRYSLRQLEVFLAVARIGTVSGAGEALAMSQSAVSGALGDLERQFGKQLFDRVGKRLRLSELGQSVRASAEGVLDRASELEAALESRAAVGRLRIGATLTIGNHLVAPLMARFMREHKGAELTLAVANTEEIARRVSNFDIDVGLVEGEVQHPDIEVTPWRDDELVVFCAPDHPYAKKRALTDADLRSARWIVREHGSGTRQTFDRAMHGLLGELDIILALEHTEAIRGAVVAGLGIGCVSRIALQEAFEHGSLKPCRVPHRDFRRELYLLLNKHKYRGRALVLWVTLCRETRLSP